MVVEDPFYFIEQDELAQKTVGSPGYHPILSKTFELSGRNERYICFLFIPNLTTNLRKSFHVDKRLVLSFLEHTMKVSRLLKNHPTLSLRFRFVEMFTFQVFV